MKVSRSKAAAAARIVRRKRPEGVTVSNGSVIDCTVAPAVSNSPTALSMRRALRPLLAELLQMVGGPGVERIPLLESTGASRVSGRGSSGGNSGDKAVGAGTAIAGSRSLGGER